MTDRQIEKVLKAHGVRTEWRVGRLYAFDAWTVDGVPGGRWVLASDRGPRWLAWFLQY